MLPEQCRAARNWLGWSMDELAAKANCSNSTIRDFEARRREPHRNRLGLIRQALEVAGIVFSVNDKGDMASISGPVKPIVAAEKEPPARTGRAGGNKRRIKGRR
jgi:transcriptional regulator with XRE-family HTH domain